MVTMYIGGGLANKMFQYAFSLAIKKKGYDVVYDTITFKTEFVHDRVELDDIFPNVNMNKISKSDYWAAGKQNKLARLVKRISPKYIMEHAYLFNDKVWEQIEPTCYLESSWQDENYFVSAADEVRQAFVFPPFEDERNVEVAKAMASSNSVAIHIRKGDGYGTWNIFSNTCPKEYYDKALGYIKEHVENPKFFIFTDSPDVVKEYLDIEDYTLINWNPTSGKGNYWDMQLMSCAKHNVIANSTYSWWGAWLNSNPSKIVIGPKYWFNPECKLGDINHVVPNHWIKL